MNRPRPAAAHALAAWAAVCWPWAPTPAVAAPAWLLAALVAAPPLAALAGAASAAATRRRTRTRTPPGPRDAPFTLHTGARIVWAPPDGLPDPADAPRICALAAAHRIDLIVVAMAPPAEHAARLLIAAAWQHQATAARCPIVLADGTRR